MGRFLVSNSLTNLSRHLRIIISYVLRKLLFCYSQLNIGYSWISVEFGWLTDLHTFSFWTMLWATLGWHDSVRIRHCLLASWEWDVLILTDCEVPLSIEYPLIPVLYPKLTACWKFRYWPASIFLIGIGFDHGRFGHVNFQSPPSSSLSRNCNFTKSLPFYRSSTMSWYQPRRSSLTRTNPSTS